MTSETTDFVIFYSWQSDLPGKTNRYAISAAIQKASSRIEAELPRIRLTLDEATRDEPGSPNIPVTILEKIKLSDAFICDITTINSNADGKPRPTPNPNVLFELGYAVSQLGWPRVIMLFNKDFGDFDKDRPFDIDRQRASTYRLSEGDAKNKSDIANLENLLHDAITSIVEKNPTRPTEARDKSPEEIHRLRDVQNITWALSTLHIPTIGQMINELPYRLHYRALQFWESYQAVVSDASFHVYDDAARSALYEFLGDWRKCISYNEHYSTTTNPKLYILSSPEDASLKNGQGAVWDEIESARNTLQMSFCKLLNLIRTEYLEIDLDKLSRQAWEEHLKFEALP